MYVKCKTEYKNVVNVVVSFWKRAALWFWIYPVTLLAFMPFHNIPCLNSALQMYVHEEGCHGSSNNTNEILTKTMLRCN